MRRENRLASEADFRRVRQVGRAQSHPLLVAYAARSNSPTVRAGFTVGKRVGGAVRRNRVRRRLRELVRSVTPTLTPGWDLVLSARPAAAEASYADLGAAVEQLLGRLGVAVGSGPGARSG